MFTVMEKVIKLVVAIYLLSFYPFLHAGDLTLVSPNTLTIWGYHPLNKLTYLKTYCDQGDQRSSDITYQAIKSNKPVAGESDVFYRYTLIREHYENKENLNLRLLKLRSPINITSKHKKLCNLRSIFSKGEYIYILHTDSGLFSNAEMSRVLLLYKRSIK